MLVALNMLALLINTFPPIASHNAHRDVQPEPSQKLRGRGVGAQFNYIFNKMSLKSPS